MATATPTAKGPRFRVAGIEPPEVRASDPAVRLKFWRAVLSFVLEAKDAELAAGLDRYGKPMAPLAPSTILNRRSAMGPADPNGPALQPAHGLSRTRALLTGAATSDGVVCWWLFDAHTRDTWGAILAIHRKGGKRLPRRDVIGLSPASKAKVKARAEAWWSAFKAEGAPAGPRTPAKAIYPHGKPDYLIGPAVKPKPAPGVSELVVNGKHYTFQSGTASQVKKAIAAGKFTGFRSAAEVEAANAKFTYKADGSVDWAAYYAAKAKPPVPPPVPAPPPPPYRQPVVIHHRVRPTPAEPLPDYHPSDEQIAKAPPKPKKPKAPPKPKPPKSIFPESIDGLELVRRLGGSTGAQLVRDPATGRQYVLKRGGNAGHLESEAAADELYRAAGVDVPAGRLYRAADGPAKLTEFHEGKTLGQLRIDDQAAYEAAAAKLREHFAVDALMGNWDVIGAQLDNVLVTPDGRVLRIDNGGSLSYRAQGAKKSSSQWNGAVTELQSLRNPFTNPSAGGIFHKLSDDDVRAQAKALAKLRAKVLKAARPDELDVLAKRFDALAEYAKPKPKPKPISLPKGWKPADPERFRKIAPDDVPAWGAATYDKWAKGITSDEREAVKSYTASNYIPMNDYLRGIKPDRPASADAFPALDRALEKGAPLEDLTVYRGFRLEKYKEDPAALPVNSIEDFRPGMILTDKGYTSTSPNIDKAWGGVKVEIRVKKGTPGAYVDKVSSHRGEQEFLLSRTVERFIILEVRQDRLVVEALMPDELKPKRARKPKPPENP